MPAPKRWSIRIVEDKATVYVGEEMIPKGSILNTFIVRADATTFKERRAVKVMIAFSCDNNVIMLTIAII